METNVNNTFFTGKFLLHLPSVDSTNNYAKTHIAKSSPIDGTVILADEQVAGRGQSGTVWLADAHKNLTFSIIYKTSFLLATEQFYLSMAVSLGIKYAVSSMISKQYDENCLLPTKILNTKIKWPNDIYVNDKKIAGILIENTISGMNLKHSIIGIGLNVNQEHFSENINATSLKLIAMEHNTMEHAPLSENYAPLSKNEILYAVLASIEKYFLLLKERKFERLKIEYVENLFRFNISAVFKKDEKEFEGKIIDIDEIGNLIIETSKDSEASELKFGFKEVSFVI